MMLKFISIALCLITTLFGMEADIPFSNQDEYNVHCAKVLGTVYQEINANNKFSKKSSTNSESWEIRELITMAFLVKKRGIPLSKAIKDLTSSTFNSTIALEIGVWRILASAKLDEVVANLEEKDPGFFFSLIKLDTLLSIQLLVLGRAKEWEKVQAFKACIVKLKPFTDCITEVPQKGKTPPYDTVLGGTLYFPNLEGITGDYLVCVDAEKGLYYGFGPFFKDGPKTLFEIGKNLEQAANLHNPKLYVAYLAGFNETGTFKKIPKGTHPLQYQIKPGTCCYFSLEKIKLINPSSFFTSNL